MKKIIVPFLLLLVLAMYFSAIPLSALSASKDMAGQFRYWIIIASSTCIILAVFINRDNLALYNLDKLTLIIIVIAGTIRISYLNVSNEIQYKNIVLFMMAVLLGLTLVFWKKIPGTNISWVVIGIFSCIVVIPLAFVEITQIQIYLYSNTLYADHFGEYALRNLLYNFSFVAPFEEIVFRGILWGELRKRKFEERTIIWIQGILFWRTCLASENGDS